MSPSDPYLTNIRPVPNKMLDILKDLLLVLQELLSHESVAEGEQKVHTLLYSQTLATIVGVVGEEGVLETVPLNSVISILK